MALIIKRPGTGVATPAKTGLVLRKPPAAAPTGLAPTSTKGLDPNGSFAKASAERKKIDMERAKPWDVSVPVGGSLECYLLDHGEPFGRYEHSIGGGPNKKATVYPCLQDTGQMCPACAKEGKTGTWVQYLTAVLPLDKYTNKDGEEVTRRFVKRLFPIRNKMSPKYARIYQQYGTFRGLLLRVHRDGKMDPKTGSDVTVIRVISEIDLKKYANPAKIAGLDKDGLEFIRKAKIDEPFDYKKAFPVPTPDELAKMLGAAAAGGGGVGGADFDEAPAGTFTSEENWGVEA